MKRELRIVAKPEQYKETGAHQLIDGDSCIKCALEEGPDKASADPSIAEMKETISLRIGIEES